MLNLRTVLYGLNGLSLHLWASLQTLGKSLSETGPTLPNYPLRKSIPEGCALPSRGDCSNTPVVLPRTQHLQKVQLQDATPVWPGGMGMKQKKGSLLVREGDAEAERLLDTGQIWEWGLMTELGNAAL